MSSPGAGRAAREIVRRCYVGLDAMALGDETLRRLRKLMPIDAAFFATVDPATLLFTSALTEEPLATATSLFMDNEFGQEDVNKFAALARSGAPVASLDQATGAERSSSLRYQDVMAPLSLGDELRAALLSRGRCWGVMCLHREDSPLRFSEGEIRLLRSLAPHLAEGLRRAVIMESMTPDRAQQSEPGIIILAEDFSVVSMNGAAERWVAELTGAPPDRLPVAIYAAAAQLAHTADGVSPTTRLRTSQGQWVTVHASRLQGPHGSQTAVIVEAASPAELSSLVLDAHGLTPAQSRVAALVLQGLSTRQIVKELQISSNTVQEHLRAVFDKFGIGSRRELVAVLLARPR